MKLTIGKLVGGVAAATAIVYSCGAQAQSVDASGKVQIQVFYSQMPAVSGAVTDFAVPVPSDYVAVGGGTQGDGNPGRFITASYPNAGMTAWLVSSKDDLYKDASPGIAYAIGMKVAGLTRDQLMANLVVNTATSGNVQHPDVVAGVPPGYTLIGGGIKVNSTGEGNMATGLYPESGNAWHIKSSDHVKASPATAQSFAIGLRTVLPGIGTVVQHVDQEAGATANEYPFYDALMPAGWAVTGCGAKLTYSGYGLMLVQVYPQGRYCRAFGKDQYIRDIGAITTYAVGIAIQPTTPGTTAPQPAAAAVISPNPIYAEGTADSGVWTYATVNGTMTGGTPPFNYAWSVSGYNVTMTGTSGSTASFAANFDPCAPAAGTGTVSLTVTDATNQVRTTTAPITLAPVSNITQGWCR